MSQHTGAVYYLTTRQDWFKHIQNFVESHYVPLDNTVPLSGPDEAWNDPTPICVVVVTHESKHWELENDPAWEALPHPLSGKQIPADKIGRFKGHPGLVPPTAAMNTWELAHALKQSMPTMGWRIF